MISIKHSALNKSFFYLFYAPEKCVLLKLFPVIIGSMLNISERMSSTIGK